jgi:hypothetical protein
MSKWENGGVRESQETSMLEPIGEGLRIIECRGIDRTGRASSNFLYISELWGKKALKGKNQTL